MNILGPVGSVLNTFKEAITNPFGQNDQISGILENLGLSDTGSDVLKNLVNPGQVEREFNAEQAQMDRDFQASQAQINRDYQASMAQKAMDYQTEMSNTAHQRAIKDLEAAGLNPYLATGVQASAPSGVVTSGAQASGSRASAGSANSAISFLKSLSDIAYTAAGLSNRSTGKIGF